MQEIVEEKVEPLENKEAEDALYVLLHCALKDKEYTTQLEQFNAVYEYIQQLEYNNATLKKQVKLMRYNFKKAALQEVKENYIPKSVISEKIEEFKRLSAEIQGYDYECIPQDLKRNDYAVRMLEDLLKE